MNVLRALWRGDMPLGNGYWLYGWCGLFFLCLLLIVLEQFRLPPLTLIPIGVFTYTLCVVLYWVIATVGIWRSATTYTGSKLWAVLAKLSIVLGTLWIVSHFGLTVLGKL